MSSFTYITGVPAADNDPSVDQPNMVTNTNSIPGLIAIDHVSFNASNGGTHLQITFSSNNVPTVPTSPPVLFTNLDSNMTSQLFFYSGNAAHSSTQYVQASNGSTMLLGGIIMKWGFSGQVASGTTISFTSPFPNNCFNVQLTVFDSTAKQTYINISAITTSGFTMMAAGSVPVAFYYSAIGN